MKIFAFIGSYRTDSINKKYVESLCCKLIDKFPSSTLVLFSPNNSIIYECHGCLKCFFHEKCNLQDDFERIKCQLLQSDLIIFASPVYCHQISGAMKTFIDRCGYMMHIFECRGKIGVCVNISYSNGNNDTEAYLSEAMAYMGIVVIDSISLRKIDYYNEQSLDSIIEYHAKKITKIIESGNYYIPPLNELSFQATKSLIRSNPIDSPEKTYWINNKLFTYNSFRELFNVCFSNKLPLHTAND